jgi:hypothetical protein
VVFRNKLIIYGEKLLAPRPTPKLEDRPLSAVRDCLFNIFAATLQNWRGLLHPQPEDAPCRGDKEPTWSIKFKQTGIDPRVGYTFYVYHRAESGTFIIYNKMDLVDSYMLKWTALPQVTIKLFLATVKFT